MSDEMTKTIAVYDPRMNSIVAPDAQLKRLAGGGKHTEGPVYLPQDDSVIFSDVSGDRLLRWSNADGVSIIHQSACYYHNGNALDPEGRLIGCSHGKRAIVRREHDGEWKIICDRYQNNRLITLAKKRDFLPDTASTKRYSG